VVQYTFYYLFAAVSALDIPQIVAQNITLGHSVHHQSRHQSVHVDITDREKPDTDNLVEISDFVIGRCCGVVRVPSPEGQSVMSSGPIDYGKNRHRRQRRYRHNPKRCINHLPGLQRRLKRNPLVLTPRLELFTLQFPSVDV
jgi:hypothetical protein